MAIIIWPGKASTQSTCKGVFLAIITLGRHIDTSTRKYEVWLEGALGLRLPSWKLK
jgi:hypothetical protein